MQDRRCLERRSEQLDATLALARATPGRPPKGIEGGGCCWLWLAGISSCRSGFHLVVLDFILSLSSLASRWHLAGILSFDEPNKGNEGVIVAGPGLLLVFDLVVLFPGFSPASFLLMNQPTNRSIHPSLSSLASVVGS